MKRVHSINQQERGGTENLHWKRHKSAEILCVFWDFAARIWRKATVRHRRRICVMMP